MKLSAIVRELIAAGLTGDDLVSALERIEESSSAPRSQNAIRQARFREKKKQESVTSNVTCNGESVTNNVTNVTESTKEIPPIPPKENTTLRVVNNPPIIPPSKKSGSKPDPEGFSEFWSVYPKRDGSADRKGAVKAWNGASRRADFETIMAGVEEFAEAMERRGKVGTEFIPQARTWLNGDRWNDHYDEPEQNGKEAEWRAIIEKHAAPTRS